MKAININALEIVEPDHRTRKAYRQLIDLRNQFIFNQIDLITFIESVERVIFNKIPIKDLVYLNDGLKNGAYLTILKLLVKSESDWKAAARFKVDLLTVY